MAAIFRNGKLFCDHCGKSQAITPCRTSEFVERSNAFEKKHEHCEKTWTEPEPDMNLSKGMRIRQWAKYGEHGSSSIFMLYIINGTIVDGVPRYSHPHDPDDFRRCYRLLKFVPELREDFHVLADQSETWSNLVQNWDKLTQMLEEQIQTQKINNGMYKFMKTLGC